MEKIWLLNFSTILGRLIFTNTWNSSSWTLPVFWHFKIEQEGPLLNDSNHHRFYHHNICHLCHMLFQHFHKSQQESQPSFTFWWLKIWIQIWTPTNLFDVQKYIHNKHCIIESYLLIEDFMLKLSYYVCQDSRFNFKTW